MKISVKGRYGLAVMICLAQHYNSGENITVLRFSKELGFSKIYLEQVFSLIKRAGLVVAVKGAQGGYQLARHPKDISVFDVLSAIEYSVFEKTEETVEKNRPDIEKVMQREVFTPLDRAVEKFLKSISLMDLANDAEGYKSESGFMYFI